MSGRVRMLLRRLRTLLWTAVTLVILLAAVLVGVGKLLMPYSVQYKPQFEAWLSREFQQPVTVDSFNGEWKAFGPRISLENVGLHGVTGDEPEIAIQHAALDIKPLNLLISGRPLYTFRIIGADLALVRTRDGQLELSGLGVGGRGDDGDGSGLNRLATVGELRLERSRFSYDDDLRDIHLQLTEINGRLQIDGDELGMEVRASVSDNSRARVLGDLDVTLLMELEDGQRIASARWHAKTGELMLSDFVRQLPAHELMPSGGWLNAELWGSWDPAGAFSIEGVLDIRDIVLEGEGDRLNLSHMNTKARWRFHDRTRWRLDLADLRIEDTGGRWGSQALSVERNLAGGLGVWVSADNLQTEFSLRLTHRFMSAFNARWPRHVPSAARGRVRNLDLVINSARRLASARGTFENIDILQWGGWPRLSGISGSADMAFGEGEIRFSGTGVGIDWERNFRSRARVDIPRCEIEILWGGQWQVDVNHCAIRNETIRAHGRTRFAGNEGKPALDINVRLDHLSLDGMRDYWPASIMKPGIRDWLSRSLVSGQVTSGRLLLSGDMDDWPFRGAEGVLDARIEAEDVTLDYRPGWPAASGLTTTARFQGVGMRATGQVGSLAGGSVDSVSAVIEDFQAPVLDMEYSTRSSLPHLLQFISRSPLLEEVTLDLGEFEFRGAALTSGKLSVPLGAGTGPLLVDGRLQLADDVFVHRPTGLLLDSLNGEIRYDHNGFAGSDLQAAWLGWPSALSVRADWDATERFRAELSGRFPASLVVGESPYRDDPLLAGFAGESDWNATLTVTAPDDAPRREVWLHLASDLRGVSADLPPPMNKETGEAWPFTLAYPVRSARPVITAGVGTLFNLRVEGGADGGAERASLHFGSAEGVEMPARGYFDLTGSIDTLDLDGWTGLVVDYFKADRHLGELTFGEANLFAENMIFFNRRFPAVGLRAGYQDPVLTASLESRDLVGEVRYSRGEEGTHSLAAEMEHVFLPEAIDDGVSMDIDPAQLPEMHLYVKHMNFKGLDLGETRIEAYPQADGLRFESVEAKSEALNFQARGDWTSGPAGSRSDFDIVMTSESLGSLVEAMNLSSVLEGGQTMIRYDAWWQGPPAAFALAIVNGDMSFSVVDGKIANADPGAGRVLGLMSIAALPRRLALDFRDVFGSGFRFDQASGTVRLENGIAHTNDFTMESTAARLSIEGTSDLVNQRFDYRLTVRPGVSQALPVIGAIAAGPGGAAAGLALQGLLRDALGDAAEARYSIKGPWDAPEVTRLEVPEAGTAGPGSGEFDTGRNARE